MAFEWDTIGEEAENGYLLLNSTTNADRGIDEFTYANNARLLQVKGAVPAKVVNPSIPVGATDVYPLPTFDWEDSAAATRYHVFIRKASEIKPDMPTASGLAESNYTLMQPLKPWTEYRWQVVAVNDAGASAGDEWSFTTKSILPGDINNDGNVDLADAILALKIIAGMDTDQTVCEMADVNGDGKIGLSEVIYILQKMSGLRQ